MDSPLAEWAYITPRFPAGIPGSRLPYETVEVRRETALFWFYVNLRPYGAGLPSFGFAEGGGAPFGHGTFASEPIAGRTALAKQFEENLGAELLGELGATLGDRWEWIEPEPSLASMQEPHDQKPETDLAPLTAEALEAMIALVSGFPVGGQEHGGMGHNGPPDDPPLTAEERDEGLSKLEQAKEAVGKKDEVARAKLITARQWCLETGKRLGAWLLERGDEFGKALAISAGKNIGENTTPIIIIAASALFLQADQVSHIIEIFLAGKSAKAVLSR